MYKLVCVFVLITSIACAQNLKRPLSIDDYFNIKTVGDPQISPDGAWVAYTVTQSDLKKDKSETRIWMIPYEGGDPLPMTSQGYSASNPRWSPDGKYLSFMASRDEEEKTQVWTLDRRGGEAQQATFVKQGISGYEWSPDGKRLLLLIRDAKPEELTEDKEDDKKPKPFVIDRLQFKMDYAGYLDRRRTHLYIGIPGDSAVTQITSGDFDDRQPAWSPDGKSIAFVSNRTDNPDGNRNSDIWVVSADNTDQGKTLLQVTTNPQEDSSPSWSPDGKMIAHTTIIADERVIWYATNHLAIAPASGGAAQVITRELDRNVSQPRFSYDGNKIWFILEDSGENQLASVNPDGSGLNREVQGEVSVGDFHLKEANISYLTGRFHRPSTIFTYAGGESLQITKHNEKLFDGIIQPEMENIHFNSADGTEIEGFVIKPAGFNPDMKYPLILWIHGGPVSQFDHSMRFEAHLYAANGYVVLLANPRGSSGYGQDFSYAIFADWGNKDYQDLMAGVDFLINQGYVDENRLGVGGWSYGGILTNYVITKTTRFAGAISGASEALYRSNYGHDHYQLWWEQELGLPWETPENWERISPFNQVDKITTPTLWIGGAEDWNVPILNSEQMYQAMKRLGSETQLVVYPGEHHGIRRPSFQKDRFQRFLGWFDQHVKNGE